MIKEAIEAEQVACLLMDDTIVSYEATLADEKLVSTILQELLAFQTGTNPVLFGGVEAALDTVKALKVEYKNIWEACLALRATTGGILYVKSEEGNPLVRKLWLWSTKGEDKGQQLRLGKNLLGIKRDTDYRDLITRPYIIGDGGLLLSSALIQKEPAIGSSAGAFGYLTLGGLYSCYKNWTGLGDALPAGMQVFELGYGWFSPDNFVDPGGVWSDEALSYDGNLTTFAITQVPAYSWCDYLELRHAAANCTKVRWCMKYGRPDADWEQVDIYHAAAWHYLCQVRPNPGTWQVQSFGVVPLERFRIRAYNSWQMAEARGLYEVEFYGTGGVVDVSADWHQGADERTLRCAIGDYDPTKTYGITYWHTDYLKAWDTIGAQGIITRPKSYNASVRDELIEAGRVELTETKVPRVAYEIDVVDLSNLTGFDFERLQLGSRVKVIDEELGIETDQVIVRLVKSDLSRPLDLKIELANRMRDLTDVLL